MDFVVQHALDNVWAEPLQDKDYYIRPARITPNGGSLKYANLGMTSVALPNASDSTSKLFYHVYQIGQIPTSLLGIDDVTNSWMNIDDIAFEEECYINVFLDNGRMVPRSQCYLMRTWPGKNILLAISYDTSVDFGTQLYIDASNSATTIPATLNNQDVNVRFYTNARMFSTDTLSTSKNPNHQMYFDRLVYTKDVMTSLMAKQASGSNMGWFICNGLVRNYNAIINDFTLLINKELSVYNDETIIDTEYFRLKDLGTFTSIKNPNISKYLINLNTPASQLVYHNDVEYFLGTYDGSGFRGLAIPTLRIDPITTITNKTHGIRTDVITDLISKNNWLAGQDVFIMAVIRQGGMVRGLIHQATRIEELWKLPNDVVKSTLVGSSSALSQWNASNLEVDDYAKIVEGKRESIVDDIVITAYGYNAITRYHQPNPLKVTPYAVNQSGNWYSVQLSNVASQKNDLLSSDGLFIEVLEYTQDGLMVGRKRVAYSSGGMLISQNALGYPIYLIEHYVNTIEDSSLDLGQVYDNTVVDNDLSVFGFAAYVTSSSSSDNNPKWIDVTQLKSYYYLDTFTRDDGSTVTRFNWNTDYMKSIGSRGMVRINNRVCFKTYKATDLIKTNRTVPTITIPSNSRREIQVEPGVIELWLENRLLMEGLDYVVSWPYIYVTKRIQNISTATISLRMTGLANPNTMQHEPPREVGFAKNGVLSVNGTYDVRNDRNIQICYGGALKHRDDVAFDESGGTPAVIDGRPYQIRDYITPIEPYTNRNTAVERGLSEATDVKVMQYLNAYMVSNPTNTGAISGVRWFVVSVFLDEIIGRLLSGWLQDQISTGAWSTSDMDGWLSDIKYLLNIDISALSTTDLDYVRLIPHGRAESISLTERQYLFLDNVCSYYLNGKVQINSFVGIKF